MTAQIIPIQTNVDTAWRAYLEAAQRAQRTLEMEDGIEAGRAWRRWLEIFLTAEQKAQIGGGA